MARRGNGEGSIYRDPAGRWRASLDVGVTRTGRRRRQYLSGRTRAEVATKLRAAQAARDAGTALPVGREPTVGRWLAIWITEIAPVRLRYSTLRTYRGYVMNRIIPALGRHRLRALAPEHLERFYREMAEAGLAPATVVQLHRILSRALKVALQRGRLSRNVATLVDAPSLGRREVTPLGRAEARRVLAAAAMAHHPARWSVALALGLRQGESLGICWTDVDFEAGTVVVRHALQRQTGRGLVLVEPKSLAGGRTIVLPAPLLSALRATRAAQDAARAAAGERWVDSDLVFTSSVGTPLDPRNDHRRWKRLLAAAEVAPTRLHNARHTAATLLLVQGVSPRVVMAILGHSQISLTLGTYSHVVPELAHEAAERMAEALWAEEKSGRPAGGTGLGPSPARPPRAGAPTARRRPRTPPPA